MEYDAAFGPMGMISSSPTMPPRDPEYVKRLQRALNALGYGPLVVDGLWGPKTQAAMVSFVETLGYQRPITDAEILSEAENRVAQRNAAQDKSTAQADAIKAAKMAAAQNTPLYKNPWVWGAVAAAGLVAYVMYRASEGKAAVAGVEEKKRSPSRSRSSTRCGRTPDMTFDEGSPIELEAPPHGQEVTDAED